ncbi:hypothetical protein BL241_11585 [Ralstonia solanacearum]|nr:hypothetical protein BL241_11585 [Ralstonia solanacearum]
MSKGSIIKRTGKDGAVSWLLKYDAERDALSGKRQQRYKTVRGTKAAAEKELRRLLAEVDNGTHVGPVRTTVAQWVETWLSTLEVLEKVSVRTREGYSGWLRLHVVPTLGNVELQKLTAAQIDALYAKLLTSGSRSSASKKAEQASGLSPQTVLHVHRALFSCLKAAVKKRLIARNPAEDAESPKPKRTRNHASSEDGGNVKALDREQCATLLDAFRDKPLYCLVALGLATGLRRGEMLALRWSAIDLDKKTLRVDRAVENSRTLGVRIKADAKNESSRRTIRIDDGLCDLLRAHRKSQKELALKLGVRYPADCLVYPCVVKRPKGKQPAGGLVARDVDFGRPWDPEAVTKEYRRVVVRAGFPDLRLHDLRHTHATLLLLEGVPVHSVAQRLGHSTPVITMTVYGHVIQRAEDQAAQVSGDLLKAAMRL